MSELSFVIFLSSVPGRIRLDHTRANTNGTMVSFCPTEQETLSGATFRRIFMTTQLTGGETGSSTLHQEGLQDELLLTLDRLLSSSSHHSHWFLQRAELSAEVSSSLEQTHVRNPKWNSFVLKSVVLQCLLVLLEVLTTYYEMKQTVGFEHFWKHLVYEFTSQQHTKLLVICRHFYV